MGEEREEEGQGEGTLRMGAVPSSFHTSSELQTTHLVGGNQHILNKQKTKKDQVVVHGSVILLNFFSLINFNVGMY